MKILITGGTGFLGTELVDQLIRLGHEPIVATRSLNNSQLYPCRFTKWPLSLDDLGEQIHEIEACIHLAGEPIAEKNWSAEQKKRIYESRISGTRDVVQVLEKASKLKVFLCGSAIGIYGNRGSEDIDEDSGFGTDFLADVCKDWEDEGKKLTNKSVRTVFLRTGLVLGRGLGLLNQLEPLFHHGVAGPIGSGQQYMSWIHVKDWVNSCIFALDNESITGPLNLTAPYPQTNKTFTYTMGKIFKQSFYPPAPAFALKIALGEKAVIALEGQKALPKKLLDNGFKFSFSELNLALEDLYETQKHPQVCDYFSSRQFVPAPLEEVFDFFSKAENLEQITPPMLNFKVLKMSTKNIQKGTLIDYKLKIHGFPAGWRTLIDEWSPTSSFVDTQLKGPYNKWHHTHTFERFKGGTLMKDRVHYKLPMGYIGRVFGHWMVKKDVRQIFGFRTQKINELFPGES